MLFFFFFVARSTPLERIKPDSDIALCSSGHSRCIVAVVVLLVMQSKIPDALNKVQPKEKIIIVYYLLQSGPEKLWSWFSLAFYFLLLLLCRVILFHFFVFVFAVQQLMLGQFYLLCAIVTALLTFGVVVLVLCFRNKLMLHATMKGQVNVEDAGADAWTKASEATNQLVSQPTTP